MTRCAFLGTLEPNANALDECSSCNSPVIREERIVLKCNGAKSENTCVEE